MGASPHGATPGKKASAAEGRSFATSLQPVDNEKKYRPNPMGWQLCTRTLKTWRPTPISEGPTSSRPHTAEMTESRLVDPILFELPRTPRTQRSEAMFIKPTINRIRRHSWSYPRDLILAFLATWRFKLDRFVNLVRPRFWRAGSVEDTVRLVSSAPYFCGLDSYHLRDNVGGECRFPAGQKLLDLRSELNKDAAQFGFSVPGALAMLLELNAGLQEETMRRFVRIISFR